MEVVHNKILENLLHGFYDTFNDRIPSRRKGSPKCPTFEYPLNIVWNKCHTAHLQIVQIDQRNYRKKQNEVLGGVINFNHEIILANTDKDLDHIDLKNNCSLKHIDTYSVTFSKKEKRWTPLTYLRMFDGWLLNHSTSEYMLPNIDTDWNWLYNSYLKQLIMSI